MAMKQKLNLNIDFSYLENAIKYTYDFEITPELFTGAFIDDKAFSLMFFGDEQFDDLENEELIKQMKAFANKPLSKKYLKINDAEDLEYHVYRYYTNNDASIRDLVGEMARFIGSRPLKQDINRAIKMGNSNFAEYRSWNGSRYDTQLAILILLAGSKLQGRLTPARIRELSNILISFDDKPYKLYDYVQEKSLGLIHSDDMRFQNNVLAWGDGHVDWAKIAKDGTETEGTGDKLLPPGLKKEMARFGLDIVFDESVSSDERRIWTDEDRNTLVDYNFNDVLGTRIIGENDYLSNELKTRDIIRMMYPYTCARSFPTTELKNKYRTPSERDATAANLAGLVLIGPNKIKPVDYAVIDYRFPLPDGKGGTVWKDLLEHIKEKEEFLPPFFEDFFAHFRGQNTQTTRDDKAVKYAQPITHSSTMNTPYYKDGKPINAYIRVSTGGAHGSTCANLSMKSQKEIEAWIRADEGADGGNKFTVDAKDVIHADWSSFYPVMASKMGMYRTAEGIDRYSGIIDYRFQLKKKAHKLWEEGLDNSKEYIEYEELQMGLKFILNNATGAGNMHNPYALLPVDNKTISMRLIGNMFIWALGQRLAQAGAYIISTNTDGLFFSGLTVEKAQEIMDGYIADYGMDVEPELMARFINRDTSNRAELNKDVNKIDKVGGQLRHAIDLDFNRRSLGQNVQYPLVAGNAVLHYMATDDDWLQKPYDRERLKSYIEDILAKGAEHRNAWFHTHVGTGAYRLTLNGERQARINRIVLTKEGHHLGGESLRALAKQHAAEVWNAYALREVEDLHDVKLTDVKEVLYQNTFQNMDLTLDNVELSFIEKYTIGREEFYKPLNTPHELVFTGVNAADDITWKLIGSTTLGYKRPDGQWEPIKLWKPSTSLNGYPSQTGLVLNTYEELNNFDYSQIDVDAYVNWAEELLKHWKSSADVPELGMKKVDDTVVQVKKKIRRTKATVQVDKLRQFYGLAPLLPEA